MAEPMRVLLDTNIVIHREGGTPVRDDIGVLFWWLDRLHYVKCMHPVTVAELMKHKDPKTVNALLVKTKNYHILKTQAPFADEVVRVGATVDGNENDANDTRLINELYNNRVSILVSEDRKLLRKAAMLGIADRVFTIDGFLEKVSSENPALAAYDVLAVKQELFGNVDVKNAFFDTLREDYPGFDKWFNTKADEVAYVCRDAGELLAFLYLKQEGLQENYADMEPQFRPKRRLKIGTLKVGLNGYRIGERFLKIVFDNALRFKVDEIYVTIFDKRIDQLRLISLLEDFGFVYHGIKHTGGGEERVYVRNFNCRADRQQPSFTYPFCSRHATVYLAAIWPDYHTELFPDSILRTESPADFTENEPHRNAIRKVFVSRAMDRDLASGDIIVFYRTGGYHKAVVSTIGIVEEVILKVKDEAEFVRLCKKRSVFSDAELIKHWNYKPWQRPFIVNFLYAYSLPRRINMKRLIEMGVLGGVNDAPRGFKRITQTNFRGILTECEADPGIVAD